MSASAILIGRRGQNGLQDTVHVLPAPPTQQKPDNANCRVRLEDIRRYVCHGVLREEDGWVREEKEWTMRRKEEEEEDATLRERRGGTAMGEPHAWRRWEEITPGEGRRRETHGNS